MQGQPVKILFHDGLDVLLPINVNEGRGQEGDIN